MKKKKKKKKKVHKEFSMKQDSLFTLSESQWKMILLDFLILKVLWSIFDWYCAWKLRFLITFSF